MGIHGSLSRGVTLGFWLVLVLGTSFCYEDEKSVIEVVGIGECADCAKSNIKTSQALSGKSSVQSSFCARASELLVTRVLFFVLRCPGASRDHALGTLKK